MTIWNNSLLYHFKLSSFFIISRLSLETFSSPLEGQISIQQFFIAVLPLDAISLLELLFVFVHEAHEVNGKVMAKMEFTGNVVGDSSEISENCHNIRLLVVVRIVKIMVPH